MGNMSFRDPKTKNSESRSLSHKEIEDRLGAFIKGGSCKETYAAYEDCLYEAEKKQESDDTKMEKCLPMLLRCMEAHSDYYQPLLAVRKAADERVEKEFKDLYRTKLGDSNEEFLRFVKGSDCKELAVAFEDCTHKKGSARNCTPEYLTMWKCMEAHPDYYQPFVRIQEIGDEEMRKGFEAVVTRLKND